MNDKIPYITQQDVLFAANYIKVLPNGSDMFHSSGLNVIGRDELMLFRSFNSLDFVDLDEEASLTTAEELAIEPFSFNPIEIYSTSQRDENRINEDFMKVLHDRQRDFCIQLRRTDFEDGYDNEIIDEVDGYMRQNKYATTMWLHELYGYNQKDSTIVAGLLRIIGSVVNREDIVSFIALIKCGLNDKDVACQEAALMAIEVARTKECLDAIETTTFHSHLISRYAEKVRKSLRKELGYAVENDR